MKKIIFFAVLFSALLHSFIGCEQKPSSVHEAFFGVIRYSEGAGRLVVYIPEHGDVEIPENEGCCSCFDGHEPNEAYNYRLKVGDLVKINFKYEKAWDDDGVKIMESYPARFDRKAGHIEALRENISFEKGESGYVHSFMQTDETGDSDIGDTLYFILHGGYDGKAFRKLYAEGTITDIKDGIITVSLTIIDKECDFLKNYTSMSIEASYEK